MNSPVKDKKELLNRLSSTEAELRRFGVTRVGIFGSFVRDKVTDHSDVDFFVEFNPAEKNFDNFMNLLSFWKNLWHEKLN